MPRNGGMPVALGENPRYMKTSDFDYHLPKELIAQTPMELRDHSRLMVVSRHDGSIQHRHFYDLPEFLRRGDVLVFNDSRVIPARLYGRRAGSGGRVEVLLLHRVSPGTWRALVRPGRRLGAGTMVVVPGRDGGVDVTVEIPQVESDGTRVVKLSADDDLSSIGVVPLPPYIRQPLDDPERYQTVYARDDGSVAAPTAGLHFTPQLLDQVRSLGAETVFVTLHVGWGSFRPVRADDPKSHDIHSEYWELGPGAADAINRARHEGRRVISVGTTAVRLLEQAAALPPELDPGVQREGALRGDAHQEADRRGAPNGDGRRAADRTGALNARFPQGTHQAGVPNTAIPQRTDQHRKITAGSGWADLFILPGHKFRAVDALVTNFHLPRSTLLMLTCAFAERDLVFQAYHEAVENNYRFYSFGDAMLIL